MPVKLRWQAPPFAGICHIYRAAMHCQCTRPMDAACALGLRRPRCRANTSKPRPQVAVQSTSSGLLQGRSTPSPTCAIMDSDSEPVTRSHVGGSPWVDPRAGSSAAPQARPGPMRPGLQVACQPEVEADIRTTAMARAVTTGGAGADSGRYRVAEHNQGGCPTKSEDQTARPTGGQRQKETGQGGSQGSAGETKTRGAGHLVDCSDGHEQSCRYLNARDAKAKDD
jgi:hypothetical protein